MGVAVSNVNTHKNNVILLIHFCVFMMEVCTLFGRCTPVLTWFCISSVLFVSSQQYPFQNPKLPWTDRVSDLVGRLTLDEIINASAIIYGRDPLSVKRLGIHPYHFDVGCATGVVHRNATAFPQSLGLSATFR